MNVMDNSKQKCDYIRICYNDACSYIAWNPVNRTAQGAEHFITGHASAFRHKLGLLWKNLALLRLVPDDVITAMFPTLSIAGYSFLQQSELGCRGYNENAQASRRQQCRLNTALPRLRTGHCTKFSQLDIHVVYRRSPIGARFENVTPTTDIVIYRL